MAAATVHLFHQSTELDGNSAHESKYSETELFWGAEDRSQVYDLC